MEERERTEGDRGHRSKARARDGGRGVHGVSEERSAEEVFREFWAPVVMKDGVLDAEQVKLELFDYHQLIRRVSEVYEEITGGKLSKPTYLPGVILDEHRRQLEEAGGLCRECGEESGVGVGERRPSLRG